MEKRIKDIAGWEPALAEWKTKPAKLHLVAKAEAAHARPTLVRPPASRVEAAREANPLESMDWEERFWFAFQAILELERDFEEMVRREEYFQCLTCRRETGVP